MPDQLQLRGGTTAQNNAFTGAAREVTVDTTKDTLIVHDATTAGGNPLMREDGANSALINGSVSEPALAFAGDSANTGIYSPGTDQLAVSTNGVERVEWGTSEVVFNDGGADYDFRIEGDTNTALFFVDASTDRVGVGTTSPSGLLHVSGGVALVNNVGDTGAIKIAGGGSWNTITSSAGSTSSTAKALAISLGSSEALRIDSSGRVGIGTSSPEAIIHTSQTSSGSSVIGAAIRNSAETASTGVSLDLSPSNRTPGFRSAQIEATNNGNNAITLAFKTSNGDVPATRMVVTPTGAVGIGTTSPADELHVNPGAGNNGNIRLDYSDGATASGYCQLIAATDRHYLRTVKSGGGVPFAFEVNSAERARIDSSGRLLVGTSSYSGNATLVLENNSGGTSFGHLRINRNTSSPADGNALGLISFSDNTTSYSADIAAARDGGTWSASSKPTRLVFSTTADGASSPTERMRITSGGFLKVSNTGSYLSATGFYNEIGTNQNSWGLIIRQASTSGDYYGCRVDTYQNKNDSTSILYDGLDGGSLRFRVFSNGGIYNYQGNNANLSDEREKKNIETLDSTWSCLKNWELKKFHYNEDADTDDKRYGVIAQQVAPHCPEVITDWVKQKAEDAVLDDDGNVVTPAQEEIVRMGVKEQQMMWMAIKALQEAQTRIETLEAEVAALKAA